MAASVITRTTWTDDSGSGLDGTIINNAQLQAAIYDKIDALLAGTGSYVTLELGGYLKAHVSYVVLSKTGTYTALVTDDLIVCPSGTFTITLPAASGATHPICIVNNGTGTITIGRTGSDTVGLATSQTLNPGSASRQGDSMTFAPDGTSNWNIL